MRERRLKKLWRRLHEMQQQYHSRHLAAQNGCCQKKEAGRVYFQVKTNLPKADEPVYQDIFSFRLRKKKLREVRRRKDSYLLRSNLTATDPAMVWRDYIQLTEIEQAFKELTPTNGISTLEIAFSKSKKAISKVLKGDLSIRHIYHQTDERIEAHIFVAFRMFV